ncbi:MAG: formimidoylglutamase [Bacteroidales bacterium]|nr:formimidoylglutamase [Bacteroidales bacterium]
MDLSIYFEPVSVDELITSSQAVPEKRIGDVITTFKSGREFPVPEGFDIAVFGVQEERNAFFNKGCAKAPDNIRQKLYNLYQGKYAVKIVDMGNIKPGNHVEDTYYAVASVVARLIDQNVLPVILGGSQDLTFAQYKAYESLGRIINMTAVDHSIDLGNSEEKLDSRSYLSKIILQQPNYLFNYTNIGYQTYFVDHEALKLMKNLHFDVYRLGNLREDIRETEPLVRNTDLLSFDISAVRQADAPGNKNASPNGFYGEEACKICRYAGMSDKISSVGFYEVNPERDYYDQTALLTAQMIWYFIDGYYNRKNDEPARNNNKYIRHIVMLDDYDQSIEFYKSKKSDRWWMLLPSSPLANSDVNRNVWIPCSYDDYKLAAHESEIPDKWWKAYQKLSV